MAPTPKEALDLKEACVQAAHEAIAEHGLEKLSLRDVARRLGVSHQAPYKHYPSRDHLLAEVMRRCFAGFADELDARERHEDPSQDLDSLGRQYLRYAAEHPLEYRLMFATPWPEAAEYAEMCAASARAFDVLRVALQRLYGTGVPKAKIDADAMFIWSCVHGQATLRQLGHCAHLNLAAKVEAGMTEHALSMVTHALRGALQAQ
ncbi:MAG: TetR/AcrR family transcriptional regulator [Burkholderiales bacterium]